MSDEQFHDDNQRIITQILLNNKYPIEFIKIHMRNRLNKILYVDKNKKDCKNVHEKNFSTSILKIPHNTEYKKISKLFAKHNIRTVPILNKS